MRNFLEQYFVDIWYRPRHFSSLLLVILSKIFSSVVILRRHLYKTGYFRSHKIPVPIIIVGNISVGGTGKTPLTIALAKLLHEKGYRPGIVLRGYKSQCGKQAAVVEQPYNTHKFGDEACLLVQRTGFPVAIGRNRVEAADLLIRQTSVDCILADDGLQHYSLQRDIEIAVIDGYRGLGNRYCLPAGPLREPKNRLKSVDYVVATQKKSKYAQYCCTITAKEVVNISSQQHCQVDQWQLGKVHAVAGVGNSQRFFDLLQQLGFEIISHSFSDHHDYIEKDFEFGDGLPVIMTEKDAVKCTLFTNKSLWYLPIEYLLEQHFSEALLKQLSSLAKQ